MEPVTFKIDPQHFYRQDNTVAIIDFRIVKSVAPREWEIRNSLNDESFVFPIPRDYDFNRTMMIKFIRSMVIDCIYDFARRNELTWIKELDL